MDHQWGSQLEGDRNGYNIGWRPTSGRRMNWNIHSPTPSFAVAATSLFHLAGPYSWSPYNMLTFLSHPKLRKHTRRKMHPLLGFRLLHLYLFLALVPYLCTAVCPFTSNSLHLEVSERPLSYLSRQVNQSSLMPPGGYDAVKKDIAKLLVQSQDFWPADFGHYGGLMIRLAWHSAGGYRSSDGRGGMDGARIRFFPEFGWPDNTNLDKALRLLEPIKEKYGPSLSWGDLIALAGLESITSMGGPSIGFCGGRIDAADGTASLPLGPSQEQDAIAPCPVDGECEFPLGQSVLGLIYVNPAGFRGIPDPNATVADVRSTFQRMGMDDIETVALIGGGHKFGKMHGACLTGPGPGPLEDPSNPYPGTCGTPGSSDFGKGINTFTSGFEGPWTTTPTEWSNAYFANLLDLEWELITGPGGNPEWRPLGLDPSDPENGIRMLTTDIALRVDPAYRKYCELFKRNQTALDYWFARTWYKLQTRDMGPATRCIGPEVPPPQPFQRPLPPPPSELPNFAKVSKAIKTVMLKTSKDAKADVVSSKPYFGALFVHLAYQCASTFRATDYQGGCNGATIRFRPERGFPLNKGVKSVLKVLRPVYRKFSPSLTWADLIVLAGYVALEDAGGDDMKFCPGRSDAPNTPQMRRATRVLAPRDYIKDPILSVRDNAQVMGLSDVETVALAGRLRSPTQQKRVGFSGSYNADPSILSNDFYRLLLSETWVPVGGAVPFGNITVSTEFQAEGKDIFVTASDLALIWDRSYRAVVVDFVSNEDYFKSSLAEAWVKLMNADRFDGPITSVCDP